MTLRWYTIVMDCLDVPSQARWWAETLGYELDYQDGDEEAAIVPASLVGDAPVSLAQWREQAQAIVFVPVPEGKTVKNRLHIDLAPHTEQDREAEIEALLARGARRVDVGQSPDVTWTVLADPEGNEFCVLSARDH